MKPRRRLVIFSSLPMVGGHTTTTLKLCELIAPSFAQTFVIAKEIPGHGHSDAASRQLESTGVEVLPWVKGSRVGLLAKLLSQGRPEVFLSIGMRHLSPVLAVALRPRRSFYYHITHELSQQMRSQLEHYAKFFSRLVFLSPATWHLYGKKVQTSWALQPTALPHENSPIEQRPAGPIRLGFLGRLNEMKGLGALLDIIESTNSPCELHIAGTGELEPRIRELAAEADRPGRVVFHGSFQAPERADFLRRFFSRIDRLCAPSLDDREGIPNVILEALQCGVPVLTTPTGGMRSFALAELGPAPASAVRLVEPSGLQPAIMELVSSAPPDLPTRRNCLRYFEAFFSDAVLRSRWMKLLGGSET